MGGAVASTCMHHKELGELQEVNKKLESELKAVIELYMK
jgi:hypothetical protein